MKYKYGFTFYELMAIFIIIFIFILIFSYSYKNYILKSQISTAILELNDLKSKYELISKKPLNLNEKNTLLESQRSHICIYSIHTYNNTGNFLNSILACEFKNVMPNLNGKFVYLTLDNDGIWKCNISKDLSIRFKPLDCL